MKDLKYDAVIVGSGPNGLVAGIILAEKGLSVLVIEAKSTIGGGSRSEELTLPGFIHDVCSTIHPLAAGSPVFRSLPLSDFGLEFIWPPSGVAHPLDNGDVVLIKRSFDETAATLGEDGDSYRDQIKPFADAWNQIAPGLLGPLQIPEHPFLMARFGLKAMQSARGFAERHFKGERARAVFAGIAAHSMIPLEDVPSAAFGLVLAITAHAVGWCLPRGGSQQIVNALVKYFLSLGGKVETDWVVEVIDDLPPSRVVLFDLSPRQIVSIAGSRFSESGRRSLSEFRYGAGVFKMDFALSEPIPWSSKECLSSATVHLGGTLGEISDSEKGLLRGRVSDKPFVIFVQTSLFDETRAPSGKHTGWAYCHVPNGFGQDMSEKIVAQIERFAPGFRDCVLARHIMSPQEMEAYNSNYVGGDIGGGLNSLGQLFTRPTFSLDPYKLPADGLYICSASTPPGGGVHGMCGFHAARSVLDREFGITI